MTGVETYLGMTFLARCVVITAGTFLNGLMHIGRTKLPGGRCAEPPSLQLSESIARHGITLGRMKTGTPVRIDGRSVHFEDMTLQPGDTSSGAFSYLTETSPAPKFRISGCSGMKHPAPPPPNSPAGSPIPTRPYTNGCDRACPTRRSTTDRYSR